MTKLHIFKIKFVSIILSTLLIFITPSSSIYTYASDKPNIYTSFNSVDSLSSLKNYFLVDNEYGVGLSIYNKALNLPNIY